MALSPPLSVHAQMLIRRPASEVFRAFVEPAYTTKFWFTRSTGPLVPGAQVHWEWEMYGAGTEVRVVAVEQDQRLRIEWDDPPRPVEWRFEPRGSGQTLVTVETSGFRGTDDEIVAQALDAKGGFTTVLAACKAFLEHGLQLELVRDQFPDAIRHQVAPVPEAVPPNAAATERLLHARPSEVFAAFEQADKLARWWGPSGFRNTFERFEFRPGGRWVFVMHGPNGTDYANESVFREIEPDRRIVIEHVVKPWYRLTVTLAPRGDQTHLSWVQEFESPEAAAKMRRIVDTANEQNLDRLEAVLAGNTA
ncbi:MAG TPA: SRPBCC domain-containing protein [Ramlibacter sp.]